MFIIEAASKHRDGDLGSGEPDLVARQGGQVLQQAAEAAVGLPEWVVLAVDRSSAENASPDAYAPVLSAYTLSSLLPT